MKRITFSSNAFNDQFEESLISKLRIRFPDVIFAHVQDPQGTIWEESRTVDIRLGWGPYKKDCVQDLTPLLNESVIDLRAFIPDLLEEAIESDGTINGLPFERGTPFTHALFYNIDIFDQLGVPYPEDGMTWDEVIELSRHVTGTNNGIQYYGLDIGESSLLKVQFGLTFLDPLTHKSRLQEDDCQEYFRLIRAAYSIPNNLQDTEEPLFKYGRAFHRKGNVAMCIQSPLMLIQSLPFELGAVTFPRIDEVYSVPSLGGAVMLYLHANANDSKLAFEVMSYLVSKEFQHHRARSGYFTSLIGDFEHDYGQDSPSFAGKSMSWLFQGEQRGWPKLQSPYEDEAMIIVKEEMERTLRGGVSWDDAISQMEQRIRNMVEQ